MPLTTVVKGLIEAWWTDVTTLVSPQDGSGNAALGPVRAQVTAAIPVTGSVTKGTAGAAAPDQTLKQFSSSGGVSINTGATVALYTVTAGKTFYATDIVITGNAGTATQFLVQLKQGTTVIFEGYCKTDTEPLDLPGIETQPQAPGGAALTLVFGTGTSTTAAYFIGGFEQ